MEFPSKHDTDGSSIKPVSSLRSHFENLQGGDAVYDSTQRHNQKQLTRQFHQKAQLYNKHDLGSHLSLDTSKHKHEYIVHDRFEQTKSDKSQDSSTSISELTESDQLSTQFRHRSIGHLSPPLSPPSVAVNSPFSLTSKSNDRGLVNKALPVTRELNSISVSASKETRIMPDEYEHQVSQAMKRSLEKIAVSPTKNLPPPVNRAGKPKTFSKFLEVEHKNTSTGLTLEPKNNVNKDKISPFSTPPSSDDNTAVDDSPIQDQERAWYSAIHDSKSSDSFNPVKLRNNDTGSKDPLSDRIIPTRPVSRRIDKEDKKNVGNLAIDRPVLPPRKNSDFIRTSLKAEKGVLVTRHSSTNTPRSKKQVEDTLNTSTKGIPSRSHTVVQSHQTREQSTEQHSITTAQFSAIKSFASNVRPEKFDGGQEQQMGPQGSSSNFPDETNANRRPPRFPERPWEINTGYDTKVFTACGEYVCTTGFITRAWNIRTGQMLVDLTHQDTTKVTSIAFRPASNGKDEGKCLWLGTKAGEILEVDIPSGSMVNSNNYAHSRKEILRIYRYGSNMWSLDDDGKLNIWKPESQGNIDLSCTPYASRVPKGHTFSLVTGGELWIAAGRDIRVFRPEKEGRSEFVVLEHPLSQPQLGEITSGATVPNQHDRIYFGHVDGRISVYSSKQYSCISVVNLSLYKISSLVGVSDYLWAGFHTGMIYVYDTTSNPWKVLKDWKAHENHPVAGIVVDRSSVWKINRLQVVSLGTDNIVRVWDGMLRADWLENALHERSSEYCNFGDISALVLSWNAGAARPGHIEHDRHDARFFEDFLHSHNPPDLIVFGFQELVDLEGKKTTALSLFKSKKKDPSEHDHMRHQYRIWIEYLTRCIDTYLPTSHAYTLLHTGTLVGLFSCIFVRGSLRSRIKNLGLAEIKCGMGGLHGNKGALIIRFLIDDTSVCLVNCHLAAGQKHTIQRNNDIANILESEALPEYADSLYQANWCVNGGNGTMIVDHEICILNGDLNYRIDVMGRDSVIRTIRDNNLSRLLEGDQLLVSRKRNPGFRLRAFREAPITFAPTYKYDVGSDQYDSSDKKRAPAWCDRILYRGSRINQLTYQRRELRASDHRPVSAVFQFKVKSILENRQESTWKQCEEDFESVKTRIAMETNLDYLIEVFGLSTREAKQLIVE